MQKLELYLCPASLTSGLEISKMGRGSAPICAYQFGYNFGTLMHMVQRSSGQLVSKMYRDVTGPTPLYESAIYILYVRSKVSDSLILSIDK